MTSTDQPTRAPSEREARSLGRHLLGADPSPALCARFTEPRAVDHVGPPADRFDVVLARWASLGGFAARGADLYARLFRPNAWVRRKLICLLALAEVSPDDAQLFARPGSSGPAGFLLGAAARGALSGLALVVSLPLLGVLHVALGGRPPR